MNKKQLIAMWCGIAFVVLFATWTTEIVYAYSSFRGQVDLVFPGEGNAEFCVWAFLVALVTSGLIVTFADKKDKKPEDD